MGSFAEDDCVTASDDPQNNESEPQEQCSENKNIIRNNGKCLIGSGVDTERSSYCEQIDYKTSLSFKF